MYGVEALQLTPGQLKRLESKTRSLPKFEADFGHSSHIHRQKLDECTGSALRSANEFQV